MPAPHSLELREFQGEIHPPIHEFAEPFEVCRFKPRDRQILRPKILRPAFHLMGVANLVEWPLLRLGLPVLATDRSGPHRAKLLELPFYRFNLFHSHPIEN